LIPLGSLAVLNVNVEKIEDQKMYLSCVTQSRDQQTVYAKASGKEDLSPGPWPCPAGAMPGTNGRGNAKDPITRWAPTV